MGVIFCFYLLFPILIIFIRKVKVALIAVVGSVFFSSYFKNVLDSVSALPEDFALAKHSIDTIGMLKEKTKGNLTEEEDKFIESILTDLRWRYVKATK